MPSVVHGENIRRQSRGLSSLVIRVNIHVRGHDRTGAIQKGRLVEIGTPLASRVAPRTCRSRAECPATNALDRAKEAAWFHSGPTLDVEHWARRSLHDGAPRHACSTRSNSANN